MTDKALKHMSRGELLEMLIVQMNETETLKQELERAQAALRDRQIVLDEAGSIAEASLRLNGVFDAAQAAAEQYLDNVRSMQERQDLLAQQIQAQARRQADDAIAQANTYSQKVRAEADAYWKEISGKAHAQFREQGSLRQSIPGGSAHE